MAVTALGNNKYEIMKYIKTVAIYLRRSRGDLDKDLAKHSEVIYDFIKEKGWKYVEYKEIGSGSSISERKEIKHLLRDVKEGLFDAVVVFDYDRLGRGSAADQERIQNTLRLNGTLIITLNPFEIYNLSDDRDEEMLDFKGFIARREYKMITKRMQAGKKIGARMGNFVYGYPNYGYNYNEETKGLIVNETESQVVRKMVDWYTEGMSLNKIATKLNEKKIPSPRNKKWNGNTIRNIITNEVYLGRIISNKSSGVRSSQNPDGTKKPYVEYPRDEWIVVENCHEPLMAKDELMKIKSILKDKTSHHRGNGKNALSGLVKCGLCNKTMTIQKNIDSLSIKKCMYCGDNKGGEAYIVEDLLKDQLKKLKEHLLQSKRKSKPQSKIKEIDEKITELRKETMNHNDAIERIKAGYEDGIYEDVEEMKERIKERRNLISENNEEIDYLSEKRMELADTSTTDKAKVIEDFYKALDNNSNPVEINEMYRKIIRRVEWTRVGNNKINIKILVK